MPKGFAPTLKAKEKRSPLTQTSQRWTPKPMPIGRKQRSAIRPYWLVILRKSDDGDYGKAKIEHKTCNFATITRRGDHLAATTPDLDQVHLIDGCCPREELAWAPEESVWGRWMIERDNSTNLYPAFVAPTR